MPAEVIAFPLNRRVGKIRDVAGKMLNKSTDRAAGYYRDQVTDALDRQLQRLGLSNDLRRRELTVFWQMVQAEILRRLQLGSRPGGTAA